MKRVKLFDLGDNVQAVMVKKYDTDENRLCIMITFYDSIDGEIDIEAQYTLSYDNIESRDKEFNGSDVKKMQLIFNEIKGNFK